MNNKANQARVEMNPFLILIAHKYFSCEEINCITKEEKLRRLTATERQSKSNLSMPKLIPI